MSPSNPLAPRGRQVAPFHDLPDELKISTRDNGYVIAIDLPDELYHSELGGRPKAIAVKTLPTIEKADIGEEITE